MEARVRVVTEGSSHIHHSLYADSSVTNPVGSELLPGCSFWIASGRPKIISYPLQDRWSGKPTGMMTFDKSQKILFLELSLRPIKDSHLYSADGGRID